MSLVLAIYGKEDILGYVRGTLEDEEEIEEIESLVKSDPRAAGMVQAMQDRHLGDIKTRDMAAAMRRLRRLQEIARRSGHTA